MDFLFKETRERHLRFSLNNNLIRDGEDSVFHIPEFASLFEIEFHKFVVFDFDEVLGILFEGDSLTGDDDEIRVESNQDRAAVTGDDDLVLVCFIDSD